MWAMILSLCRDGCRLKRTMSPSFMCLSTTSPNLSSWANFSRFPYFKNLTERECFIFLVGKNPHKKCNFFIWFRTVKRCRKYELQPVWPFHLCVAILDEVGSRVNIRTIANQLPQKLYIGFVHLEQWNSNFRLFKVWYGSGDLVQLSWFVHWADLTFSG